MDFIPSNSRLVPRASASQAGSHRGGSSSLSSLVSTLVPSFLVAVLFVCGFLILRAKLRRVYAPRTYLPILRQDERTPGSTKQGMFGWIGAFARLPDEYVLNHQSLDQYLFLRFMKMITIMCFVGCCITWPVLLPVNATGGGGESGLDILSFSNVQNPTRYFAHAFIAYIYFGFVMFMITRETVFFINLRQAYLLAPRNASRISSRTVLFTDVPEETLSNLKRIFRGVERIWDATDCKHLQELIDERTKDVTKLEKAEINLIQGANKKRIKAEQSESEERHSPEHWLDDTDRPKHKLKPLIGKKVDTIEWATKEIPELNEKIKIEQSKQQNVKYSKFTGAVFVMFHTQHEAQTAFQVTAHERALRVIPRAIGVPPSQIVWKNLGMGAKSRLVRGLVAVGVVTFLVIFWTIPVAFVGILTNINYLTDKVTFLSFIDDIPSPILGVVTGLLPTILLALLMLLVPIFCKALAKFAGAVTLQEVELKTQSWYFAFQVIQVFLVTTFTSGASAVVTQIVTSPASAPTLLAKNLPKASNFYISYFILYGLANSSKTLFNVGALVLGQVFGRFIDKTPRKKFGRYIKLSSLGWGKNYPKWTNLGVIALAYSCIAPILLGFATIGLGLLYICFRYQSFFVVTTDVDTHGRAYGRALQQLTVGVYLAEICLIGLFAINIGTNPTSSGPMILMIILLIGTILYHKTMRSILHPLTECLPETLLNEEEEAVDQSPVNSNSYDRERERDSIRRYRVASSEAYNGRRKPEATNTNTNMTMNQPASMPTTTNSNLNKITSFDAETGTKNQDSQSNDHLPAWHASQKPRKNGSIFSRFFKPNKHTSYFQIKDLMRSTHHNMPLPAYSEKVLLHAYNNPAIRVEEPVIWLAKDELGMSGLECRKLGMHVRVADHGAWIDEKNKVEWDEENPKHAPIWDEEILMMI